jgi:hypothetical protein
MSYANPTSLRIGMRATLAGRPYRVAGRAVLGVVDDGEPYYWNEFNLVSDAGETATLVYEETEHGGQWRLFVLFDPEFPMSAADAATKRVGDRLNLDGVDVHVTLVDQSRVYYIEGEGPAGEDVGDVAHYFNAEAKDKMVVVSWTGDEVEYYHGRDLPRGTVASAFNLPHESASSPLGASGDDSSWVTSEPKYDSPTKFFVHLAVLVVFVAIIFSTYSCHGPSLQASVTKTPAPAVPLLLESSGKLDGKNYRVTGHSVAEIAEVGLLYDRHEYQLVDDDGNRALLVCGWSPKMPDWVLCTPADPATPLTPAQAGTKKLGEVINIGDIYAPIDELFLSTVQQPDPATSSVPGARQGDLLFGFGARSGSTLLLASWNNDSITFQKGIILPAQAATAAFTSPAADKK